MLVPVVDLVGNPGATRSLHRTVAVGDVGDDEWGRVGEALRGDLTLALEMDSVVEGIWVHGDVSWMLELECGRCLLPVTLDRTSEVGELFFDPKRVHADDEDVDEGYMVLEDGAHIDLERMLHDVVVLDLPVAVRCERADCEPPTVDGVAVLSEDEHRMLHEDAPDPRWAELANLKLGDG